MDIYVINESTLLNDVQAWNLSWALDYQAKYHFGRAGWRSDVRCSYIPGGGSAKIPVGGSVLHLLDTSDQPGALGYHDEDGKEVPFAKVFVKTSQEDGDTASEVASHEVLELAVDPHVNDSCLNKDNSRLYAKEVGDPCQGNGYDIGVLEGRTTGIIVADFVLPNYFDPNTAPNVITDFRGALKGPFALGPQGYFSFIDMKDPSQGWQQTIGSERTKPVTPDKDDRIGRRS